MRKIGKITIYSILIILGLSFLYPLFWMINLSLKSVREIYQFPFSLPKEIIWENYPNALSAFNFLTFFLNSVIYSIVSVFFILLFGSMLAYFLARMETRFHKFLMNYIVMGIVIPTSVTIIPIYMMLSKMHLKNTRGGLILIYTSFGIAGTVIMLYAFLRSLPKELEEAAMMDGCSIYGTFFRIIIPCIKPALFTRFVIEFMNVWNDYFVAYILTNTDKLKTLQVGIKSFFVNIGTSEWGMIGAAMVVSCAPVLIIYFIFSEQIENALTAGAVLK